MVSHLFLSLKSWAYSEAPMWLDVVVERLGGVESGAPDQERVERKLRAGEQLTISRMLMDEEVMNRRVGVLAGKRRRPRELGGLQDGIKVEDKVKELLIFVGGG